MVGREVKVNKQNLTFKKNNMRLKITEQWTTIYKLYDDPKNPEIFIARSYKSLVTQMRKIPFDQPETNAIHRSTSKEFFKMWDGTLLDDSSDKAFVQSLIKAGFLRILGMKQDTNIPNL